jgi:GTPase-activating protein BEM2
MTAEALAIVFSPNLLRAPHNDFAMILANMGSTHQLVKALITHVRNLRRLWGYVADNQVLQAHLIFDDPDLEIDGDQDEEESNSAILEEDEDQNDLPLSSTFEPLTSVSESHVNLAIKTTRPEYGISIPSAV